MFIYSLMISNECGRKGRHIISVLILALNKSNARQLMYKHPLYGGPLWLDENIVACDLLDQSNERILSCGQGLPYFKQNLD